MANISAIKVGDTSYGITATPTAHASTATTYGGATASNYGHVKLSDNYTSSAGAASSSIGASSKAVYDAYNTLNSKIQGTHVDTGGSLYLSIKARYIGYYQTSSALYYWAFLRPIFVYNDPGPAYGGTSSGQMCVIRGCSMTSCIATGHYIAFNGGALQVSSLITGGGHAKVGTFTNWSGGSGTYTGSLTPGIIVNLSGSLTSSAAAEVWMA